MYGCVYICVYECVLHNITQFILVIQLRSKQMKEEISNITLIVDCKLKCITEQHNETIIKINVILSNQNTIIEKCKT